MSAPVDELLRAELEAVREASRAGEIVAAPSADDARSMARHVAAATLRLVLFLLLTFAAVVALVLLG